MAPPFLFFLSMLLKIKMFVKSFLRILVLILTNIFIGNFVIKNLLAIFKKKL